MGGSSGISGKVKKSMVEESCAVCLGAEVLKPCIRGIVLKAGAVGRWPPEEWKVREPIS